MSLESYFAALKNVSGVENLILMDDGARPQGSPSSSPTSVVRKSASSLRRRSLLQQQQELEQREGEAMRCRRTNATEFHHESNDNNNNNNKSLELKLSNNKNGNSEYYRDSVFHGMIADALKQQSQTEMNGDKLDFNNDDSNSSSISISMNSMNNPCFLEDCLDEIESILSMDHHHNRHHLSRPAVVGRC